MICIVYFNRRKIKHAFVKLINSLEISFHLSDIKCDPLRGKKTSLFIKMFSKNFV